MEPALPICSCAFHQFDGFWTLLPQVAQNPAVPFGGAHDRPAWRSMARRRFLDLAAASDAQPGRAVRRSSRQAGLAFKARHGETLDVIDLRCSIAHCGEVMALPGRTACKVRPDASKPTLPGLFAAAV
jgi:hypothetical protein